VNRRIAIALLAACLISAACTFLLGRKLKLVSSSRSSQMFRYVAPSRAIEPGEILSADDLGWTNWPRESPISGAQVSVDHVLGRVVLYPVGKGEPILDHDLADPGTGGGLASRIPKGMRALALRSDDVVGVAGFLAPGSRLDVLVTYRANNSEEPMTATVLENAEVLAAGQRLQPDPTGKPASATVVTLLLTPVEAERAVLASTQGTVHFVLRNGLDKDETVRAPISMASLARTDGTSIVPAVLNRPPADAAQAAGRGRPADPSPQPPPSPRESSGVETILGGDRADDGKQP
jgi:pilus assembly protein CpaB